MERLLLPGDLRRWFNIFLHFILTSRGIGFCNVECQMSNVGRNLTHVSNGISKVRKRRALGRRKDVSAAV